MRDDYEAFGNPLGYTGKPGSTDGPEPWKTLESARNPVKAGFKFQAYSADTQDEIDPNSLMNGYLSAKQESEMDDGNVMDYPDFMNRPNPPWDV